MNSKKFLKFYCIALLTALPLSNIMAQSDTIYLDDNQEVFSVVSHDPEPIGGRESFDKWIQENFKEELKSTGNNEKKVFYVQFIVQVDGTLSDIKILKGFGESYDEEVKRVVKENPTKWRPARQNNKPVKQANLIAVKI